MGVDYGSVTANELAAQLEKAEAERDEARRTVRMAHEAGTKLVDKLDKSDVVISTVLSALSVENGLDDATNMRIIAAIEAYQKGE